MTIYLPAEAGEKQYDGRECEVLHAIKESNYPDEWPFRVRFPDGHELTAWASELSPIPELPRA